MIAVRVVMKFTNEPLKRTPVVLQMDADGVKTAPVLTDRSGVAHFELPPGSGKVLVSGVERYHGTFWTTRSWSTSGPSPSPRTAPRGRPASFLRAAMPIRA